MAVTKRPKKARPSNRRKAVRRTRRRKAAPKLRPGPIPGLATIEQMYEELLARENVVGCYVGHKRVRGKDTGKPAVVCLVVEKLPKGAVSRANLLPRYVSWQATSKLRRRLLTDVRRVEGSRADILAGPGDGIESVTPSGGVTRPAPGTAGVALSHPTLGTVLSTAAHVILGTNEGNADLSFAPGTGPVVSLVNGGPQRGTFRGETVRVRLSADADYALIKITGADVRNAFQDTFPLAPSFVPGVADIGKPLIVLTRRGARATRFRGLFGQLLVGNHPMRNLLLTDFMTEPGDSGSALVDEFSRVWGLLVGAATVDGLSRSLFISVLVPIAMEGSSLL